MANPNKIPVFDVVAEAYRFAFGRFVTILGASGIPFAAMAVLQYFTGRMAIDAQIAALEGGQDQPYPMTILLSGLASTLLQAAVIGVVAAALHRMVLFGETAPRLRFGSVERKFVLVSIIFSLAFMVPALLIMLVAPVSGLPAGGVGGLGGIVAFGVLVTILSVFLMMVFPIIVAEGKIDPRRSIELVSGNWWRVVGTNLVASLPLFFLSLVLMLAVGGGGAAMGAAQADTDLKQLLYLQRDIALPMAVVDFLLTVVVTAIGVGILSYSYKALNGQALSATLTDPPPE